MPKDERRHDVLTPEQVRQFCERYVAAWNTRDPKNVSAMVAPDVIWRDDAIGAPATSPDEVASYVSRLLEAVPDLQIIPVSEPMSSLDGTRIALHYVCTGTQTGPLAPPGLGPTNQRMEFDGVTMIWLAGGRIRRYRTVYNLATVSVQLGALPKPGSFMERMGIFFQRLAAILLRRRAAEPAALAATLNSDFR